MKKVLQVMIVAIIAFNLIAMPVPESFADNPKGTVTTKFFNPMQMNSPSIIKYFDKVFDMESGLSGKMIVSADNKAMLAVYKLNSGKCDWYKWNGTQWVYQYSFDNIVPGFEEPTTLNSYKYATWDEYTTHVVDTGNGNVVTPTNTLAVTLAGPTSGVINTAYTYTATITGGTIPYTLAWSADGFVSQNEAAANYKWTTGGIKKVEVYVTDSLGQTGSDSLNVTIIDNYTLTVNINPPGAGSVTPSGGSYTSGTVVTLTETPIASYKFVNWSGDASGTGSSTTVTMNSNKTVTANFAINTYTVTFVDWNGTVLKTQSVAYGGSATPPANPTRTGYTFAGWSGSYTNVTSNRTITATYSIIPLSVSIGGPAEGKTNTSYTYIADVEGGSGGYYYSWGSSSYTTSWSSPGIKDISVTVHDSIGQIAHAHVSVTIYGPPVVSISGPTSGNINTSYTYTSSVSGGKTPYTYYWLVFTTQWVSGGSGTSCSHSWSIAGSKGMFLTVTDSLGQTGSAGVSVTISPPLSVSISGPTSGNIGYHTAHHGGHPHLESITVTNDTTNMDGTTTTTTTEVYSDDPYWSTLEDNIGTSVTTENPNGGWGTEETVTVTGNYSDTEADSSDSVLTPYTATYTVNVSGSTAPYTYLWSNGSTDSTTAYSWSTTGTNTVSLTVHDRVGQTASASLTVSIGTAGHYDTVVDIAGHYTTTQVWHEAVTTTVPGHYTYSTVPGYYTYSTNPGYYTTTQVQVWHPAVATAVWHNAVTTPAYYTTTQVWHPAVTAPGYYTYSTAPGYYTYSTIPGHWVGPYYDREWIPTTYTQVWHPAVTTPGYYTYSTAPGYYTYSTSPGYYTYSTNPGYYTTTQVQVWHPAVTTAVWHPAVTTYTRHPAVTTTVPGYYTTTQVYVPTTYKQVWVPANQ